jgi:hypothetical protein
MASFRRTNIDGQCDVDNKLLASSVFAILAMGAKLRDTKTSRKGYNTCTRSAPRQTREEVLPDALKRYVQLTYLPSDTPTWTMCKTYLLPPGFAVVAASPRFMMCSSRLPRAFFMRHFLVVHRAKLQSHQQARHA